MLPIVAASTVQFRRGGLQIAALSTILFVGVVVAQYLDADRQPRPAVRSTCRATCRRSTSRSTPSALNVFGFFAVALLSGSLAERARGGEVQLEQATEEIADLQAFNQYVLDNLMSGLATADAAEPPAHLQPLGDDDHRPATARCRSASPPPRSCSCRPAFAASMSQDLARRAQQAHRLSSSAAPTAR